MSAYKCIFRNTYLLLLCFILCLSLFGCTDYDDKVLKFYHDTESGAYNAIKFDFGDNNSGIYLFMKAMVCGHTMNQSICLTSIIIPKSTVADSS